MYIWEVPRSRQDSWERDDLTFNVWEEEKSGVEGTLVKGSGRAKEFHGIP